MQRWMKRFACVLLALTLMLVMGGAFSANATEEGEEDGPKIIRVKSALTGEVLYYGGNLQTAFDKAERGSVVTIESEYTLEHNVILRVEVKINGHNLLKFSDYSIQLEGNGAIYVSEKFKRSKYITAKNSYSSVDWFVQEGYDGYIYYLITTPPNMDESDPTIIPDGDLLGVYVDKEKRVIYLDAAASGLSTDALTAATDMTAKFAEKVDFRYDGHAGDKAANGMIMVAEATNTDYDGVAEKFYEVVLLGDVNGNGVIDAADASLICFHASGSRPLTGVALLAADANRDGKVDEDDAMFICKKYIKPDAYVTPLR